MQDFKKVFLPADKEFFFQADGYISVFFCHFLQKGRASVSSSLLSCGTKPFPKIHSTLVTSKSKGPSETL